MYVLISPQNVDTAWLHVAPWIAQAIGGDVGRELEDVRAKAIEGSMQIWVAPKEGTKNVEVVLVTESRVIDDKLTLVLRILAGSNIDKHMIDFHYLENWANSNGFHSLHIWGREGWRKKLKPLGFRYEYTVLSKVLDKRLH